jgi:hypothetical protein
MFLSFSCARHLVKQKRKERRSSLGIQIDWEQREKEFSQFLDREENEERKKNVLETFKNKRKALVGSSSVIQRAAQFVVIESNKFL